jgi:hypothetical protein
MNGCNSGEIAFVQNRLLIYFNIRASKYVLFNNIY